MIRVKIVIAATALMSLASAVYAWSTDGKGHIRCRDGSAAAVRQLADGNWTVDAAGNNGKTGGSFVTEGKAALYACGEGDPK